MGQLCGGKRAEALHVAAEQGQQGAVPVLSGLIQVARQMDIGRDAGILVQLLHQPEGLRREP